MPLTADISFFKDNHLNFNSKVIKMYSIIHTRKVRQKPAGTTPATKNTISNKLYHSHLCFANKNINRAMTG